MGSFGAPSFTENLNMKKIITSVALAFCLVPFASFAEAEQKKVCVEQKDAKTGKTKEVCKTVKVHKKLEGTKVPDKKK
jgi:hypothetical protein